MIYKKLIIFSKPPVPGKVKTRLIPALGISKATQLHQHMLEQTVEMASKLHNIDCELHCSDDINHLFFIHLSDKYGIRRILQHGNDLGERMSNALKTSLINSQQCIIIGTDCPSIDQSYIYQAFEQLINVDVILGPALDGGYVLIGSRTHHDQLFKHIIWSTSDVFKQTVKNVNLLKLKYHKLKTLSDVDTGEDLDLLSPQYLHKAFT